MTNRDREIIKGWDVRDFRANKLELDHIAAIVAARWPDGSIVCGSCVTWTKFDRRKRELKGRDSQGRKVYRPQRPDPGVLQRFAVYNRTDDTHGNHGSLATRSIVASGHRFVCVVEIRLERPYRMRRRLFHLHVQAHVNHLADAIRKRVGVFPAGRLVWGKCAGYPNPDTRPQCDSAESVYVGVTWKP